MLIHFDTEFAEFSDRIELISIGLVSEDNRHLYIIMKSALDGKRYHHLPWIPGNVLPEEILKPETADLIATDNGDAADAIRFFVGADARFMAYYAAYDWVVLCQLFGGLKNLPGGWQKYVEELATHVLLGDRWKNEHFPYHNALADARFQRDTYEMGKYEISRKNQMYVDGYKMGVETAAFCCTNIANYYEKYGNASLDVGKIWGATECASNIRSLPIRRGPLSST